MLLIHARMGAYGLHTQLFTCVLEVDLRPPMLPQQACLQLSPLPRPRSCFKITTFPQSFPCRGFHGWKQTKFTRSCMRQFLPLPASHADTALLLCSQSDLLVPTQPKLFRKPFPVRRHACHSASTGVRGQLPGVCSLRKVMQLAQQMLAATEQTPGRYSKLHPASEMCAVVSLPPRCLSSMRSRRDSLSFPLFATAPNSLSWEKFWDFLSQYNSLVSSPNRLCAFSTGQPVVLSASKAHGTPASTKPLLHSILPGTTCGDLRLPLSSLNGQLAPVP